MSLLMGLAGSFLFKGAWRFAGRVVHTGLTKCFADQKVAAIETTIDSIVKYAVDAALKLLIAFLAVAANVGKSLCGRFWDVLAESWKDSDTITSQLSDSDTEPSEKEDVPPPSPSKQPARHRTRTIVPPAHVNDSRVNLIRYAKYFACYIGISFGIFIFFRYQERAVLYTEKSNALQKCLDRYYPDETPCALQQVAKMEMQRASALSYAINHGWSDLSLIGGIFPVGSWLTAGFSALFLSKDSGDYLLLLVLLIPIAAGALSMVAVYKYMTLNVPKAKKLS